MPGDSLKKYRDVLQQEWQKTDLSLTGLEGGSLPYALATLPILADTTLIICPTSRDAVRLATDMSAFASPSTLFPAPDHLPYHPLTPPPDIWRERMRVLDQLHLKQKITCIAPVSSVLRRLPPRTIFDRALDLQSGETLDPDQLARTLVELGYAPSPLVEEPGAFARRGHIMDIWPLGSATPCRLEWDFETIASLRQFDPATQRSNKDLRQLRCSPAHTLCLRPEDLPAIASRLKTAADAVDMPPAQRRAIVEALQQGRRLPVMETLLPCMYDSLSTLFDYLPQQARIVLIDPSRIRYEAEQFLARISEAHAQTEEVDRCILPQQLYQPWELPRSHPVLSIGTTLTEPDIVVHTESPAHLRQTTPQMTPVQWIAHLVQTESRVVISTHTVLQAERVLDLLRRQGLSPVHHDGPLQTAARLEVAVSPLSEGFRWAEENIIILTEEDLFGRKRQRPAKPAKAIDAFIQFSDLNEGDHLVHAQHGIGRYLSLSHLAIGGNEGDYLLLEYLGGDKLYLPVYRMNLVQRYIGPDDAAPSLDKLGGARWSRAKASAAKSVRLMAGDLLKMYAERQLKKGFAFSGRDEAMEAFEAAFPYDETPDQWEAIEAVLTDMQKATPMDRLICGDVGFGKTEVAMRATYRAALDGRQVAVLVPTTILAYQHFQTFTQRFKDTGVSIGYLNRFVSKSEQKELIAALAEGKLDILIGTHRLIQKDVQFKRLGLLIIDEEHRFGVAQKEQIRKMKATVDTLAMSATPIPRSLHMSLSGIRDISVIRTPPAERQAIRTYVAPFEDHLVREVVLKEYARGGQFFFVHNRVETIYNMGDRLKRLLPEVKLDIAHGQMAEHELEKAMMHFTKRETDGLICTSIIESGLDIPTANTILVNRADAFGLSQLYQIRGRVGRSNVQAYAYLLTAPDRALTPIAEKRLAALQRHTDLGSGFSIAMHDLEIRGSGNLLGAEQSGHIAEIGYEMFTQLLERAIRELQGQPELMAVDPEIQLPVSAFLPDDYVSDATVRLVCYKKLSDSDDLHDLDTLASEWTDRFGALPEPARNLLHIMEVKLLAKTARMELVQYDGRYFSFRLHETTPIHPERLLRRVQENAKLYQIRPNGIFRIAAPGLSAPFLFSKLKEVFAEVFVIDPH